MRTGFAEQDQYLGLCLVIGIVLRLHDWLYFGNNLILQATATGFTTHFTAESRAHFDVYLEPSPSICQTRQGMYVAFCLVIL